MEKWRKLATRRADQILSGEDHQRGRGRRGGRAQWLLAHHGRQIPQDFSVDAMAIGDCGGSRRRVNGEVASRAGRGFICGKDRTLLAGRDGRGSTARMRWCPLPRQVHRGEKRDSERENARAEGANHKWKKINKGVPSGTGIALGNAGPFRDSALAAPSSAQAGPPAYTRY